MYGTECSKRLLRVTFSTKKVTGNGNESADKVLRSG